jgi:quercetin dioxygenase-like cupin family protein
MNGAKVHKLDDMIGGWFVGAFEPHVLKSDEAEVAVKKYAAGDTEAEHHHKIGTEVTAIISGRARLGNVILEAGDICVLEPGTAADWEALTDVVTVVVKTPSRPGDKYLGQPVSTE